jgi:succinate dehydrogenase/fumarate reductase flavoprotein subunit
MVEMHISEVGFCSGHSASGVWTDETGATTVPGLYCAGDMASVAHNYMLGAFVYGQICGESAVEFVKSRAEPKLDEEFITKELDRIQAPMKLTDGIPPEQMEYKVRRLVNDYLQPPKVTKKMEIGLERILAVREDLPQLCARDPHELLRAMEVQSIIDCAEMAARASLYRTESRWGLYHYRVDFPEQDDNEWFYHSRLYKDENGQMASGKRPIADYLVSLGEEKDAYRKMRVQKAANG